MKSNPRQFTGTCSDKNLSFSGIITTFLVSIVQCPDWLGVCSVGEWVSKCSDRRNELLFKLIITGVISEVRPFKLQKSKKCQCVQRHQVMLGYSRALLFVFWECFVKAAVQLLRIWIHFQDAQVQPYFLIKHNRKLAWKSELNRQIQWKWIWRMSLS